MKKKIYYPLFVLLLVLGCKPQQSTSAEPAESIGLASMNGSGVIVGKIIKIEDQKLDHFPCSELTCLATVKIESVEKVGSKMLQPFSKGQEGTMRFAFSLQKTTDEFYPNLKKHFPGLSVGDRFKANVNQEVLFGSSEIQWIAYEYILLN